MKNMQENHMEGSKCMGCEGFGICKSGGDCRWVRWVLGIVILGVVFWGGVKLGMLKERFESAGFGYERGFESRMGSRMMYRGGYDDNYGTVGPRQMMQRYYGEENATTSEPAAKK